MTIAVFVNSFEPAVGGSKFENAIDGLNPLAWYRFRDASFATIIQDSSGNGYNLTKQIATALRSAVKTRTTHPGGAYFPAVSHTDWATLGTFYKGTTGLLSGLTQYTALVSFRMIAAPSTNFNRIFGVGTEDVAETGTNDLAFFKASEAAPGNPHYWKHRSTSGGLIPASWLVTEKLQDGVNRLMIVRYTFNTIYRLTSSKPGYLELTEESASAVSGTGLDAISKALVLNARSETGVGAATTTGIVIDQIALFSTDIGATAATSLSTLWTAELGGYYPSMMDFDGTTGYYSKASLATTGNKVTAVARFAGNTFAGGATTTILRMLGGASNRQRIQLTAFSSDHATVELRSTIRMVVVNSAGTVICRLTTNAGYLDGNEHFIFAAFDGDAGTAVFRIDGVDGDQLAAADRVAPTAGTLETSAASGTFTVGANSGTNFFDGQIGPVGHREAYLTNYSDFSTGNLPKAINESAWTEWGAQPLFWSHTGQMDNNKGSAGDMTHNGTITMTTGGSP